MNMYRLLGVVFVLTFGPQGVKAEESKIFLSRAREFERILAGTMQDAVYSRDRSLSQQAMEKSKEVFQKIKEHPFNLEMAKGTLSYRKFSYYIIQDHFFLAKAGKAMAALAAKVPFQYRNIFLKLSQQRNDKALTNSAQDIFKSYVSDKNEETFVEDMRQTPALHAYTDYFFSVVFCEPIEVAVAAYLPCPWVYHELAVHLKKQTNKSGPFYRWIEKYASKKYQKSIQDARSIFDKLADNASDDVRSRMVEAFVKGVILEYRFWDDAYHERSFFPVRES